MMIKTFSSTLMMTAALAMAAPVQAAPVTGGESQSYNLEQLNQSSFPIDAAQPGQADETMNQWRRGWRRGWRGCGWGRCRRGIRGGDILAGALIIGGLAAVIGAATSNRRDRDERTYPRDRRDDRPVERRQEPMRVPPPVNNPVANSAPSGIGMPGPGVSELSIAADQCSSAVIGQAGADAQIDRMNMVARDGAGWRVEGMVAYPQGREQFRCGVTAGQVDYIQIGAGQDDLLEQELEQDAQ